MVCDGFHFPCNAYYIRHPCNTTAQSECSDTLRGAVYPSVQCAGNGHSGVRRATIVPSTSNSDFGMGNLGKRIPLRDDSKMSLGSSDKLEESVQQVLPLPCPRPQHVDVRINISTHPRSHSPFTGGRSFENVMPLYCRPGCLLGRRSTANHRRLIASFLSVAGKGPYVVSLPVKLLVGGCVKQG